MDLQKTKANKGALAVLFLIAVLVLAVVVLFSGKSSQLSQKELEKRNIPAYLVLPNSKAVAYQATDAKDLRLLPGESLGEGVSYTVEKPLSQTAKELYDQRSKEGWVAIAGSFSTQDTAVIKMNNGKESIFMKLTKESGREGREKTRVVILPIKR